MSHGITCIADLLNNTEVKNVLLTLAPRVSKQLRKAGLKATGVQLSVRDNDLYSREFQCRLNYPTQSWKEMVDRAMDWAKVDYELQSILSKVTRPVDEETVENLDEMIRESENRMIEFMQKQMEGEIVEKDWHAECTLLSHNIAILKQKKAELERKDAEAINSEDRVNDMMALLKNRDLDGAEFNEALVRKIIQSISVEGKDILKITFRNGTEIQQPWR